MDSHSSTNAFSLDSSFSLKQKNNIKGNNIDFLGGSFRFYQKSSQLFSMLSSKTEDIDRIQCKQILNDLLKSAPSNVPTPATLTKEILESIRSLEKEESILIVQNEPDGDENQAFLKSLSGNWELLWTAQDPNSPESNQLLFSWIK